MHQPGKTNTTWIAHVDLDAFFASCEQLDKPEIRGRPVVVGAQPGNRGVVAAASYEARKFGIRSAMPIAEAVRRCPDAVFLRPDMEKYRRRSQQVFETFDEISPVVEKASVDEAYLDLTGLEKISGTPDTIGRKIRSRIFEATGLTASVGIGPNRLIAKLGSEAAKPDGLKIVAAEEVLDFIDPMPVSNLRGLGRRTLPTLNKLGIRTVAQLRATPLEVLKSHLGEKTALKFHRQASGIASYRVTTDQQRKSISKETTFGTDVTDHKKLRSVLGHLSGQVARTARGEQLAGSVVTLKVRYAGFETHTRQKSLPQATNDERTMLLTAWRLFNDSELPVKPVRLIGIGISHWGKQDDMQSDFFEGPEQQSQDQTILRTIDEVAAKYGKPILNLGVGVKRD